MSKGKILVVEDEKDLLNMVKYNFEQEGYRVIGATNSEAGLTAARRQRPELVILDIMLPKMDGIEFCRLLRQESQVPVIFLTAKRDEMDRVLGLKLGADDYVTKPFSVKELIARAEAILRRASAQELSGQAKKSVRIGELEFDAERHEVHVEGRSSNLPPKEFELLRLLIQAKGRVLSREDLLEKIWGCDDGSEIDTRTIDQHIARLRSKLGAERQRIVTVANFGYQIKMNGNHGAPKIFKKKSKIHA